MSIEENKRTVLAFLESQRRVQMDESLLTDDAAWWLPGAGVVDRKTFFGIVERANALFVEPPAMTINAVTAEDDRVAVEARAYAHLKNGGVYDNTYHFLFRLRDGRICEAREHNNSAAAAAVFAGSLNPG